MSVSYKKLWKILIDKDIKKKDLSTMAGISPATITKMGKNGHVTTEVLIKICSALNCSLDDIMEIIPENIQLKEETDYDKNRTTLQHSFMSTGALSNWLP